MSKPKGLVIFCLSMTSKSETPVKSFGIIIRGVKLLLSFWFVTVHRQGKKHFATCVSQENK